ncbi:uncharacterized protein METZ01_LOCUS354840 [marine metagenome]|uniref:Uncharacterized protein n=1 Tax=marine metagenome TaxID=408172 RepID=A0A382RWE9_9ZZZZ
MPSLGSTTIRDLMMTGSKGALDLIPAIYPPIHVR